jgi:hypothetical protein
VLPSTGTGTERTMSASVAVAPAVTEKASAPAAFLPPYQWALPLHGFENAGRAEGAIGQSKDK